jgi:hypothetical protein
VYEKSDLVVDHRISREKLFRDPFDQTATRPDGNEHS